MTSGSTDNQKNQSEKDQNQKTAWVQMGNYAQLAIVFPAATLIGWLIGSAFDDAEYDTVAGLVMRQLGRVPRRGETVSIGAFEFRVLRTDRRRIDSLRVTTTRTVQSTL